MDSKEVEGYENREKTAFPGSGRFDTGERAFPSPSALCFSAPVGRAECFQDALISLTQCIADAIIRQKEQERSIF